MKRLTISITGLPKAGKTSFTQRLLTGSFITTQPTFGVDVESGHVDYAFAFVALQDYLLQPVAFHCRFQECIGISGKIVRRNLVSTFGTFKFSASFSQWQVHVERVCWFALLHLANPAEAQHLLQ